MGFVFNNLPFWFEFGALIGTILYFVVDFLFSYWHRHGVKNVQPIFPFGNFGPTFRGKVSMGEQCAAIYEKTKQLPFIGVYLTFKPALIVNDPELVKHVFIKDFQYFHDRGVHSNEERDPLSGNLFSLSGEKWKNLRAKLTPTFTSGKLKQMFHTLTDVGVVLDEYIEKIATKGEPIEIRDLLARYTTDIIASVAFGIDVDSINNPDAEFRAVGRKLFTMTPKQRLLNAMTFFLPKLFDLLRLKATSQDIEDFMFSIVKQTIDHREKNNIQRKDFMQLMIQLRNSGTVKLDGEWSFELSDDKNKKLSLNEITAQSFIFYLAGFETSSTTMSFCLYELGRNKDIQKKVQREIDEISLKHDNKITYDSLTDMKYLEQCIDETLRKYPPLPMLNREVSKDYRIPNSDVILTKGTAVMIPALGLQRDEKYYPNPLQFDPDRFSSSQMDSSRPYMPFGEGPRNCIGLRMGKMLTKVGLSIALKKYNYDCVNSDELVMDGGAVIMTPVGGITMKISKRTSDK